jgi:hypothetical protein
MEMDQKSIRKSLTLLINYIKNNATVDYIALIIQVTFHQSRNIEVQHSCTEVNLTQESPS